MIFGYIKGQTLELHYDKIVSESVDYLTAEFNFFTNEWEGFTKWVHFKKADQVFDILLEDNKINKNAHLNLSAGEWEVYLHGNSDTGERITTNVNHIKVEPTGVLNGEPLPEIPLSVSEQVTALAQRAVEVAESVRTDADNGVFDGEKGEKGADGTMTFEDLTEEQKASLKGDKGDKGDQGSDGTNGKDGYTPQKGIDYFDGENGKDGQNGADGKTPEKGVDYFTEADKRELVTDVLNSLPSWNGGAY